MTLTRVTLTALAGFMCCTLSALAEDGSSSYSRRTIINSTSNTSGASGGTSTGTTGSGESTSSGSTSSTSSSEVIEQSGVAGFRHSNKFAPKYKERIQTYKGQIELGLKNGWLSAEDGEKFSKELVRLTDLEAAAAAKNYSKPEIDDLDKQFTKFNMEFSNAGQKKSAPATTTAPAGTPAATTQPSAKPATTSAKAPTKPAAKPAAKTPAKPAAKK